MCKHEAQEKMTVLSSLRGTKPPGGVVDYQEFSFPGNKLSGWTAGNFRSLGHTAVLDGSLSGQVCQQILGIRFQSGPGFQSRPAASAPSLL